MDLYFEGMEYAKIPNLMVSLAKAYSYIGDNEIALTYLEQAIPQYRIQERRRRSLGIAIAQLAEVYIKLGNYKAAKKACDEGIELLTNVGRSDQRAMPALYRAKGIITEHEGNDEAALEYFTKSIEVAKRIKFSFERIKVGITLGLFYSSRDSQKGKKLCKRALKDAKRKNHTNLEIQACDCLYKIYKQEESYVDALNYHEQKILLQDSLSAMKISHALDINNEIAEKDKLISEQAYQKELNEKELKNQHILNTALAISMLLGLLLILFLAIGYLRINGKNTEIKEKTKELLKANQRLEHSNKELERFAYITSHDLKSPVRNILNFTGLLQRKFNKEENPMVSDWLNFIEGSGKRMNRLIEDILQFSRISGDDSIEQEIINLNQMVNELSQIAQNTSNSKTVSFEVSDLPNLKWHYSKIFLLFKNLIENGIKYNQSENPIIKVYGINTSGVHSICIEDNGIGIEKEYFDKIFIMFNRLHNRKEYEGAGLGLATCKKIVNEFEGKISISSEINKGTIFKIELPNHLIAQTANTEKKLHGVLVES